MDDVIRIGDPEPIAIIGLSALMPKSASVAEFWRNIVTGEDCLEDVPESRWRLDDYFSQDPAARDKTYGRRGGFIPDIDFDPVAFGIPPNVLGSTDSSQLLSLVLARAALADAGYPAFSGADHHRTSVILGVAGTTMQHMVSLAARMQYPVIGKALQGAGVDPQAQAQILRDFGENYPDWDENSFPGFLANLVPGRIANRLDLGGASYAVDAACASSLCAVRLACSELRSGLCDLALTGGVDTDNSAFAFTSFSKTRALSPTQRVRPYDAQGDGTLIAEGIGLLVLKRLSDATAAGDRIYATIRGIGAASDGRGAAIYAPRAEGQIRGIRAALEEARIEPSDIHLIEGHGTGTAVGDGVELDALLSVYGESARGGPRIPIGSVKSQIGHTKAAAGAASLIKTALALYHKVLPPTLGVSSPATRISDADSPFGLLPRAHPWFWSDGAPRRAAVSAFGFGGANYHAVIEAFGDHAPREETAAWPRSVLVQAPTAGALAEQCRALAERADELPETMTPPGGARVAFAARSAGEAARLLREAGDALARRSDDQSWVLPSGIAFSSANADPGRVVAVFSGQGSQYVGMGRDLAVDHPAFRASIEAMDGALRRAGEAPCSAVMLPLQMAGASVPSDLAQRLNSPLYAQAAVGAFGMGAFAVLREAGLRPDMFIGHSFGELSALAAAGSIDPASYADLVVARGRALSPAPGTDAGGLIAVQASEAEVGALLPQVPGCSIANVNGPRQVVIGGATTALDAAQALLVASGIPAIRLPVAAAFHTGCVSYAEAPWREALRQVEFAAMALPVLANSTAQFYPREPAAIRDILAEQPFQPVRFREQIETAYEAGGRVFIEIGPKGLMTRLISETLRNRPHVTLAINPRPDGDASLQLHQAIASLKLLGVPLTEPPHRASPVVRSATTVRLSASANVRRRRRLPEPAPVPASDRSARPPMQTEAVPMSHSQLDGVGEARRATTVETVVALVAESHREFLSGQAALARAILDGGGGLDPAALALLRDVQDSGARLHEQYLSDQARITQELLGQAPAEPVALPAAGPSSPVRHVARQVVAPELSAPPGLEAPAVLAMPPAAAAGAPDVGAVLRVIVAELTGYPEDVLLPSMSLEADLGIDSIKRIEIIAAAAERLGIPRSRNAEAARRAGTLAELASLLHMASEASGAVPVRSPAPASAMAEATPAMPAAAPAGAPEVATVLREIVAELTGYPEDVLLPSMSLEADLGIDSIKRIEIIAATAERLGLPRSRNAEAARRAGTLAELASLLHLASEASDAVPTRSPAPAAAMPEATPAMPAAAQAGAPEVGTVLREIVAELTGYPEDVLLPSMSLEADLGIDSIKRIEIIAATAERLGLPRSRNAEAARRAGTLDELASLLHLASEASGDGAISSPAAAAIAETAPAAILQAGLHPLPPIQAPDRLPDGPGVTLIVDDGTELVGSLVDAVERSGGVPVTLSCGQERRPVASDRHHLTLERFDKAILAAALQRAAKTLGPVRHAVLLLSPASRQGEQVAEALSVALETVSALVGLEDAGPRRLLAVTRMDGQLGLAGSASGTAWQGAVGGLLKTARREWSHLRASTLDLSPDLDAEISAAAILAELAALDDIAEVGIAADGRCTIQLTPWARPPHQGAKTGIGKQDVILVSGGGRGVTARCAQLLAEETEARLVLLGRTSLNAAEPAWAQDAVGRDLRARAGQHMAASGQAPTPVAIESAARGVEAARELRRNLDLFAGSAARVEYIEVDLSDRDALRRHIDGVTSRFGPVTGLVHGAGVLADRRINDIRPGDIARVFDPKVQGLDNLMAEIDPAALKRVAVFSSTAAYHGNEGQAVYAMANEVLNKTCFALARQMPDTRFVAMNWGPWDGGMVGAELARRFGERGMRLLAPPAGARAFLDMFGDPTPGAYQFVIGDGPDVAPQAPGDQHAMTAGVV